MISQYLKKFIFLIIFISTFIISNSQAQIILSNSSKILHKKELSNQSLPLSANEDITTLTESPYISPIDANTITTTPPSSNEDITPLTESPSISPIDSDTITTTPSSNIDNLQKHTILISNSPLEHDKTHTINPPAQNLNLFINSPSENINLISDSQNADNNNNVSIVDEQNAEQDDIQNLLSLECQNSLDDVIKTINSNENQIDSKYISIQDKLLNFKNILKNNGVNIDELNKETEILQIKMNMYKIDTNNLLASLIKQKEAACRKDFTSFQNNKETSILEATNLQTDLQLTLDYWNSTIQISLSKLTNE